MEVEFRGIYPNWSLYKNQEKWIYGYLSKDIEEDEYYIQSIKDGDNYDEGFLVQKQTISQYIGIKDILNRKVFQGDIVRVERQIYTDCSREEIERIDEFVGEIVYFQYSWCIAEKTENGIKYHFLWTWNVKDDELDPDTDFMEILGNRWDNPEMAVI